MWLPEPWMLRVPPGGGHVFRGERPHPETTEVLVMLGELRPERAMAEAVAAVKAETLASRGARAGFGLFESREGAGVLLEYWWGEGPPTCPGEAHCPIPSLRRRYRFLSQHGDQVVLLWSDLPFMDDFELRDAWRTFRCEGPGP